MMGLYTKHQAEPTENLALGQQHDSKADAYAPNHLGVLGSSTCTGTATRTKQTTAFQYSLLTDTHLSGQVCIPKCPVLCPGMNVYVHALTVAGLTRRLRMWLRLMVTTNVNYNGVYA